MGDALRSRITQHHNKLTSESENREGTRLTTTTAELTIDVCGMWCVVMHVVCCVKNRIKLDIAQEEKDQCIASTTKYIELLVDIVCRRSECALCSNKSSLREAKPVLAPLAGYHVVGNDQWSHVHMCCNLRNMCPQLFCWK